MVQLDQQYKLQQQEAKEKAMQHAAQMVKKVIVATVQMKPEAIDDALIAQAVSHIRHEV